MTLAANAVEHAFAAQHVLRGVSLVIEPGEAVALMGANGAGKTTLLRILAGLLEPQVGTVELNGHPIASQQPTERAQHISVVPQARPSAFGFSALELVLMGFHARNGRFSLETEAQHQQALAALEKLEIGELAARPMTQLSGGEAQRVIMARTLVSAATYWLLDEPTANLDMRHQLALLGHVREHCGTTGSAVAIIHDPNLAERYFDRVVVLHNGRVLVDGAPRDVLAPDVFEQAFGLTMQYVGTRGQGAWVPSFSDPTLKARVSTEEFDVEPGN